MGNVYSIILCDRDLHHLPDDIYKHHKHVTKLLLRRNNIAEIPQEIKILTNLVELSLRDNLLTSVPPELACLRLLQKLSLANNRIQEPPEPIATFSHLTWLSLASNTLTSLPDSFSKLQKLTSLDLQRNRFSTIPECIFNMQSLNILLLQKNRITVISPKIGRCTQLVSLNLSYNRIQHLPIEMIDCRDLQHLLLSVNNIQNLPAELCEAWENLLNLDLHTNDLRTLPDQLGCMKSLRRLNLAINKIIEIPTTIGQLQLLEWLNLNDNKLETLPESMQSMQSLVKMGIVQNRLRTLPAALAKLNSLYKLDCRRNNIECLPSIYKDMQGIHSLLLEENPLTVKYGISYFSQQPPSLLELASRAVLELCHPQREYVLPPSLVHSPSTSAPQGSQDLGDGSGTGIVQLIPLIADLGMTRSSTMPTATSMLHSTTPQKSRYNFFSRTCSVVHPQPQPKPARTSTIPSSRSTESPSSTSSSSTSSSSTSSDSSFPSSFMLSSHPPASTSIPEHNYQVAGHAFSESSSGKMKRLKSSPRVLRSSSLFWRSSRSQQERARQVDQGTPPPSTIQQQLSMQMQMSIPGRSSSILTFHSTVNAGVPKITSRRKARPIKMDRLLDQETSPLPIALIDRLSRPMTLCDYCSRRMCTSGWIDFLEPAIVGSSRMITPVRYRMCSLQCIRQQHRESFGVELTELFETADFHVEANGDIVGLRPIVPGELDGYMIEAVQEAADTAGISIVHLFEQQQQQQEGAEAGNHTFILPHDNMPASSSIADFHQINRPNSSILHSQRQRHMRPTLGSSSIFRQTAARSRPSLPPPIIPVEIQVDSQGQLRRVVYRQNRDRHSGSNSNNEGTRRRLLDTFRSFGSQVAGQGGIANGVGGGAGVFAAAGLGQHSNANGGGYRAADTAAMSTGGGATRVAGELYQSNGNMASQANIKDMNECNSKGTTTRTNHKKYTSPFSQFDISSTDVLDTIEKKHCPTCNKNVRYFCNKCLNLVNCPKGSVPQLKLPIKIDVIKHEQERDGKSTALHAKILAPQDVEVYGWKSMPKYEDVDRLLLLFPSPDAKRLSEIDPASFDKLVVIDGTWDQANKMSKSNSPLLRMKRVTIAPHETLFWRHQRKADDHLATIEAIYYFLREYHETYLSDVPEPIMSSGSSNQASLASGTTKVIDESSSTDSAVSTPQDSWTSVSLDQDAVADKTITPHKEWIESKKLGPYTNQFDDMLWFYKYFYELIQRTYRERTDGREFTMKHKAGYIRYNEEVKENGDKERSETSNNTNSHREDSEEKGGSTEIPATASVATLSTE
ncbi:DTW domain-containing protein 1 [Lobosporangium transversale]|nr:DTW domain-containing protein 1 [Lobosporangium transversale]